MAFLLTVPADLLWSRRPTAAPGGGCLSSNRPGDRFGEPVAHLDLSGAPLNATCLPARTLAPLRSGWVGLADDRADQPSA